MKEAISVWIKVLIMVFLIPLWCLLAWNGFAWEFNLPTFSYWHWVVTALAVRGIFNGGIVKTSDGE